MTPRSSSNSVDPLSGGVPDWRKIDEYGDYQSWDQSQWRWEFKRRDKDLRFLFWSILQKEHWERYGEGPTPIDLLKDPKNREAEFYLSPINASKWGFSLLSNPLYSGRPDREGSNGESLERRTIRGYHFEAVKHGKADTMSILGLGVAITFDPNAPIAPQLDGLEDYLLSLRHHGTGPDAQRHHPAKWITYLRILDARASGASWDACTEVLPVTSARTPQTARDYYGQAVRLQSKL